MYNNGCKYHALDLFKYICTHDLQKIKVEIPLRPKYKIQAKEVYCIRFNFDECVNIEDITWPRVDTSFILECWKYLSRVSEVSSVFIATDEIPT